MTFPARPGLRSLLTTPLSVLLATVLLAGCSGGSSDPAGDGAEPTGGTSGSTDPDNPEEPTEEPAEPEPTVDIAAVENINPCESLAPEEWRPFVPRAQRDSVSLRTELPSAVPLADAISALIVDDAPKYGCVVSHPDDDGGRVDVAAWGWFLGPFGPTDANEILAAAGGDATDRGYAAITTTDFATVNAYGYHPAEEVGFWVIAKNSAARRFRKGGVAEQKEKLDAELLAVLDSLSLERDSQPRVLLPEACPPQDDPRVRAVIGRATAARGFDDGAGRIQCLYRNPERDRLLRLTAGAIPQEQADAIVADAASTANRTNRFPVDEGDGGIAIVTAGGTASSALVHADELVATFAAVEFGNLGVRAPNVPRPALIELLQSFDGARTAASSGE